MEEKTHKEIYGIIYKITNIVNEKVYIGQTTRKNGFNGRYTGSGVGIERVYNYSKQNNHISNKHLCRAIEKYGFGSFLVDEKFDIAYSKNELNEKEIYWIEQFNSTNSDFGYNRKFGGDSGKWTIDTRKDMLLKIGKPVICITTNEVFLSTKDIELKYGIPSNVVRSSIKDKNPRKGLKFKWLNFGKNQPLIDIDTLETFSSGGEIIKIYNLSKNQDRSTYCYKKEPFSSYTWNVDGHRFKTYYNYLVENYETLTL